MSLLCVFPEFCYVVSLSLVIPDFLTFHHEPGQQQQLPGPVDPPGLADPGAGGGAAGLGGEVGHYFIITCIRKTAPLLNSHEGKEDKIGPVVPIFDVKCRKLEVYPEVPYNSATNH